ncbi:MAG: sulfite exporter TauE/SafE family protein [Alphaproteobacteria bacterium]|nr:sulfite exporter TauE/SafE family protein [Alphaproteobacteria bacterium]
MQLYLPIAEMAVPADSIFLLSMFVGFLSGIFGIGGGFLTTPFLIFMGIPPAIAVGTQSTQLVASGMAGVLGHWKKGNVDVKIGGVMIAGSFFGSLAGIFIFKILERTGQIDFAISFLYILLLGAIGFLMLFESFSTLLIKQKSMSAEFNDLRISSFISALPYKMRFPRSKLYISALVPGGIGFVGGILTSILGVGGGFMMVPAMIYILGMPSLLVAGTTLLQMIVTGAVAAVMHSMASNTVDVMLALILIIGGVVGAQIGVSFSRFIRGTTARVILAVIVLAVCFQLIGQLFIQPQELYSTTVWL